MKSDRFSRGLLHAGHATLKSHASLILWVLNLALIIWTVFLFTNVFLVRSEALNSQISIKNKKFSKIEILELDSGRYRLEAPEFFENQLDIQFETEFKPKYLMIRRGIRQIPHHIPADLRIHIEGSSLAKISSDANERIFLPLSQSGNQIYVRLDFENGSYPEPLRIEEMGLFNQIPKSYISKTQYKLLFVSFVFTIVLLTGLLLGYMDKKKRSLLGVVFCFLFSLFVHNFVLSVSSSSEWNKDLKTRFASVMHEDPGANAKYGLSMATNILDRKGPIIENFPPWCRMPGYGFFLALVGKGSQLQMALRGIALQGIFSALSLSFFFWAAIRIMPCLVVLLVSVIASFIAHSPLMIYHLQIESIMPAIILLILGAVSLFYDQSMKSSNPDIRYHLILHLTFALWFAVRTDILFTWGVLSLCLYARRLSTWKYFSIPILLVLFISIPWALFKLPYTGEFSPTTNSIGASMMVGLWEIPHAFIWEPSDGSYYSWAQSLFADPTTKTTSDLAVKEVFRFWFTYPIFMISLVFHKLLLFLSNANSLNIHKNPLSWWRLYLLVIISLSFIIKYKQRRTFLLASLALFNIPIFFQFFSSSGRFYHAPMICLFAAAIALLFDLEFYRKLKSRKLSVFLVVFLSLAFVKLAPIADDMFIQSKSRYWTPFLDPKLSSLSKLKSNQQKIVQD